MKIKLTAEIEIDIEPKPTPEMASREWFNQHELFKFSGLSLRFIKLGTKKGYFKHTRIGNGSVIYDRSAMAKACLLKQAWGPAVKKQIETQMVDQCLDDVAEELFKTYNEGD